MNAKFLFCVKHYTIYHLFTGTEGNSAFCSSESLLLKEAKSNLTAGSRGHKTHFFRGS